MEKYKELYFRLLAIQFDAIELLRQGVQADQIIEMLEKGHEETEESFIDIIKKEFKK